MRRISWIILVGQLLLIGFATAIDYYFHHSASQKLIFFGEKVMKYLFVPILLLITSCIISIFIKEKLWVKIMIIIVAIIGVIIFDKLYLYPW